MTVLVSIKINDGVVMAADSASSFASGMVYRHADKIVNLRQGLPIGVMVTGAGGIGNESIDTLLKDLRRRFEGKDEVRRDWTLDPESTRSRRSRTYFAPFCPKRRPLLTLGRSGPECGCAATRRAGRLPRSGRFCFLGRTHQRPPRCKANRISASGGTGSTRRLVD
jgi:hypothetical protein